MKTCNRKNIKKATVWALQDLDIPGTKVKVKVVNDFIYGVFEGECIPEENGTYTVTILRANDWAITLGHELYHVYQHVTFEEIWEDPYCEEFGVEVKTLSGITT